MSKHTFKKEERLCSKRLIDSLFSNGSSFVLYPYRIVFLVHEAASSPVQVLISVSKRRFSRAVDRNQIKRRIREVYRLQKDELLYPFIERGQASLIVAIQYVSNELVDYQFAHRRMAEALTKLQHAYTQVLLGKSN